MDGRNEGEGRLGRVHAKMRQLSRFSSEKVLAISCSTYLCLEVARFREDALHYLAIRPRAQKSKFLVSDV